MKRTDELYDICRKFRQEVLKIQRLYDEGVNALKEYEGSRYYEQRKAEIEEAFLTSKRALHDEASGKADAVLADMLKAAEKVDVIPPTDEQLKLLQLLKMREDISANELQAIADKCLDTSAIGVVEEYAQKHHTMIHTPQQLSNSEAVQAVTAMARQLGTLFNMERLDNRSEWAAMMNERVTGVSDTTGGRAWDYYRLDDEYENASELIGSLTFSPDVDKLCGMLDRDI